MKDVCLVIGNSHIRAFEGAFRQALADTGALATLRLEFVPAWFMEHPLVDLKGHLLFHRITFKQYQNHPKIPTISVPPAVPLHLVFMGVNDFGDGLIRRFGDLHAPNVAQSIGVRHTPILPCIADAPVILDDWPVVSRACAERILQVTIAPLFTFIDALAGSSSIASATLVASPPMTQRAGLARLGEAYVKSGQFAHMQEVARSATSAPKRARVIHHAPHLLSPEGFAQDAYAWRPAALLDIHVSEAFYQGAAVDVAARLTQQMATP
jgi:hypothetical protein